MSDSANEKPPEEAEGRKVSRRDWVSLGAVLFVQTQNAFNDNFVKFVLVGLALAAAGGSISGLPVQHVLGAMIPIPFILLAPVAGFISDRFSKRAVIFFCLIGQLAVFVLIAISLVAGSVIGAVFGYFLLAVQSTFFSPAKMGILKELVGTERLGMANGLMQMLAMVGILGGMFLGGEWFDTLINHYNESRGKSPDNAWSAALIPVIAIGAGCLIPLLICRWIQKTPSHPNEKFFHRVWVRHFIHLRQLFQVRALRLTALSIAFYWFVANFMALAVFGFGIEFYPDHGEGGASSAAGRLLAIVFVGLMFGSVFVSILSRKRIRLDIVPFGIFGIAIGLAGVGLLQPPSLPWKASLAFIGFSSGFYLVPLSAYLQDRAEEDHRGRVLSANNLLTSFTGVVAIGIGIYLTSLKWSASHQVLMFAVPTLVMAFLVTFRVLKILREA